MMRAKSAIATAVPRLRRFRWAHRTARLAESFVSLFDERGVWQLERSGELLVLDRLAPTTASVIFDVAAHEGAWALAAAGRFEGAAVHAFEPIASNAPAESIVVRRGDELMADLGIDRIDLLKVDTEGFDHEVLRGFGDALTPARIPVIQFEYGPWAAQTKFLLLDFHQLLESRGYSVGRLRRRGVTFGGYQRRDETFAGLNYIAVDRERQDLLALLSES